MKALEIHLDKSMGIMCSVIVRRLRDKKWSPQEIEAISRKAMDKCYAVMKDDELLSGIATDAALMHANGSEEDTIQEMVSAAFVIKAVSIADELNAVRAAKFN